MYYRRRASPKHHNDMTEVEYGGGGHRTRLRNDQVDQLVCSRVPPAPVYKGRRGRCGRPPTGAPGGVLLPPGVGLPPLALVEKESGEGKEERGAPPPLLVLFGLGGEGARGLPWPALLFSLMAHVGPLTPRGVPVTPRYSSKIPISPGTFSISKYRLPIYQSLCLDHFDTPRHVLDHIRDCEQPSVHQNI